MARSIDDQVAYYYDSHPTEEDLMGETAVHAALVHYQMSVLHWLFREQHCAIYENLNFYQTSNPNEYPLAPDIAVIKGVDYLENIRSWRVGRTGPAPHVVFEIASDETWKKDLHEKPLRYAQMGVQEYFAYDPQQPPVYRRVAGRRLFGWQLGQGVVQEMAPGPDGRLWSAQLAQKLKPDGLRWKRSGQRLKRGGLRRKPGGLRRKQRPEKLKRDAPMPKSDGPRLWRRSSVRWA